MSRGTHIWFNGHILPANEVSISPYSHTLHYGTGAFEGIRAYSQTQGGGAIFRLQDHIGRLFETCKILGLTIPYTQDELIKAATELCKKNHFEECYLRPLVFIGDGPLGLDYGFSPSLEVMILAWKWSAYLGERGLKEGVRLKISSFIRPHVNSFMVSGKITGQYVNGVLAKKEAVSQGYHESLLLDAEGYLTEGSGENLFMIKNGEIKTTPLGYVLNGITRHTVLKLLSDLGLNVQERRFTRDEIWCADEVFLTGTAAEITPVKEIDNRSIGKDHYLGRPGPITQKIQQLYHQLVRGERVEYREWLTPIL